ncbi:hypothetical protein BJY04DRAFT_128637 [Aspergillus karnatakaensis]|uniref:uncharacterized protein n=1 Tax=Aspergillus karnatakaensis TaxID=1810916 RepID=UPI003CCCE17A
MHSDSPSAHQRYDVVFGDGVHFVHTLPIRSVLPLVKEGKLVKGCICRINEVYPHILREKPIWVIHHLHVLEYLGIHERIGIIDPKTAQVPITSWKAKYAWSIPFTPGYGLPYELPIAKFPPEIVSIIVSYLEPADKLKLARTCKQLHSLVGTSLYSVVRLNGKEALAKFERAVQPKPALCASVRYLRFEGDLCGCGEGSEDVYTYPDFNLFPRLRELEFEPENEVIKECPLILPVLYEIVNSSMMQSLRKVNIALKYYQKRLLSEKASDQLFKSFFALCSAPLIEDIKFFYVPRETTERYQNTRFDVALQDPPKITKTKCTRLNSLTVHFNGLPLSWLSTVLKLPENLQTLSLGISHRYDHGRSAMALEKAIAPVASTLTGLRLLACDENPGETPASTGVRFSSAGLTQFPSLRIVELPSTFLVHSQGFSESNPWFPPSMTTLSILDTQIRERLPPKSLGDAPELENRPYFRFDTWTANCLAGVCKVLHTIPLLDTLTVIRESHKDVTTDRPFNAQRPPIFLLGKELQALVDRGVRMFLEMGSYDLEVEVKVMNDPRMDP